MADDSSPKGWTIAALTELFLGETEVCADFAALESIYMGIGHACMSVSLGQLLEARDEELMRSRPEGLVVHDRRARTLATEMGDISFAQRRYRDQSGLDTYLLSERYDIPCGARSSVQRPGSGEPKRFEVKAMCARRGKEERGGKVGRTEVFRHACVGAPDGFRSEGMAQMGTVLNLDKVKRTSRGRRLAVVLGCRSLFPKGPGENASRSLSY